jgi:hypothetical protein
MSISDGEIPVLANSLSSVSKMRPSISEMESFRVGESSWPEITFLGPYVSSPMPELTIVFKRNLYSCSPRFLFPRTILAQVSVSSFLSYGAL